MKLNNIGVKNFITDLFQEQKKKAKRNHQRICHKLIETNRRCDILKQLLRWKKPRFGALDILMSQYYDVTYHIFEEVRSVGYLHAIVHV